MKDNYRENTDLLLDEKLSTSQMMWWITGLMLCAAIAGGISGSRGASGELMLIVIAVSIGIIGLGILLANVLILRHMRLKMDATRVWTHIPLTKDRSLNWADVRTAAVVTLKNMNYPAMIVLSVHAPAEALTRKRMMWKNPKRGEELRIPLNDTRRAIVEQQLHMTLPDIEL